jgi:hypothetical protein
MTDDAVARGAAAYAANLLGLKEIDSITLKQQDYAAMSSYIRTDFFPSRIIKTEALPHQTRAEAAQEASAANVKSPGQAASGSPPDVAALWAYAHSLDAGAAEEFLTNIKHQTEQQLQHIAQATTRRNWRIQKAYDLLTRERYEQAVEESHRAFVSNKDNYQVLEDMINIHCKAAQSAQTIAAYGDAIRWLNCALAHDQSRLELIALIADRHFLHAQQLYERAEFASALRAVKECLRVNQGHSEALALRKTLQKKLQSEEADGK